MMIMMASMLIITIMMMILMATHSGLQSNLYIKVYIYLSFLLQALV